ncbi:MAG: Helix-turn-helix domain [Candidatus Parcubacteria bacterium]|jgi:DNA-binding transcriptional ArsR family regulator
MLKGESLSVTELTERLHVKQPTVSHHLKLLAAAKPVRVAKEGRVRRYALETDNMCFSECGLLQGLK